jgi:two-component sensor histidine kinase
MPESDLPSSIAVPLGTAIHELTTNTVKYGALSVLGGSVAVSWTLVADQNHRELTIEWVEQNGPATSPSARKGFGSQLLARVLNNRIGARAIISYEPEGLRAHIAVPLQCKYLDPLRWTVSLAVKTAANCGHIP